MADHKHNKLKGIPEFARKQASTDALRSGDGRQAIASRQIRHIATIQK